MQLAFLIIIFVAACIFLTKSATALVSNVKNTATAFGVSAFVISLLMSITTSTPELIVAIFASINNQAEIILGNVFGSNIANITFIAGTAAIFAKGIMVERRVNAKDVFFMIVGAASPLLLLIDGNISRGEGILLVLLYILYLVKTVNEDTKNKEFQDSKEEKINKLKSVSKLLLWMALLVVSAYGIVWSAEKLAIIMMLPIIIISLFAIAIGTSLPELTFAIKAMRQQQSGMALGNLLGSVITNSTLVLGVASIIRPLQRGDSPLILMSEVFFLLAVLLFTSFLRSNHRFSWKEGFVLLTLYAAFVAVTMLI